MRESEKWKWSRSVLSNSLWPHGLQPTRLLHPWDFLGKSTGGGCHCLLHLYLWCMLYFCAAFVRDFILKKIFCFINLKAIPELLWGIQRFVLFQFHTHFYFFLQFISLEIMPFVVIICLPRWHNGKEFACQCRRGGFDPWVGKISWRSAWQPTPVFLPAEFHGQRSLAGYRPWGHKELDRTVHACSLLLLSLLFVLNFVWQKVKESYNSVSDTWQAFLESSVVRGS